MKIQPSKLVNTESFREGLALGLSLGACLGMALAALIWLVR
jgi:hypothetical protein